MIESLLTNTRIICLDAMTEDILDRMIFYLAGKDASVAVIADPRPFPLRDKMLMKLTPATIIGVTALIILGVGVVIIRRKALGNK